jgi:hypothetical protein
MGDAGINVGHRRSGAFGAPATARNRQAAAAGLVSWMLSRFPVGAAAVELTEQRI